MRILDIVFAVRPMVLIPAWSFFILGAGHERVLGGFPWFRFATFTAVMIGVHLVNQIVDRESDRINAKGFFLQRGIFTPRDYAVASSVCILAGLAAAWSRDAAPVRLTAAAALGLAYSLPPLRLCARAGFDLVANATGYGVLAPALGAAHLGSAWLLGTACAVAAVFLHTTLLDLEGDRRTGKRSIGVVLGETAGRALAFALSAGAVAGALGGRDPVLAVASAGLAAACLASWILPRRVTSRAVCVGVTAVYVLAAAVRWPPFLPAVLGLAVVTRLYYARRFRIRYPAL